MLMNIALVGLGGMLGAIARFGISQAITPRWGASLPIGTLIVNLTGSFLIGVLLAWLLGREAAPAWRLFLVTGVLGGYTTFSAYAFELVDLILTGRIGWSAAYLIASNLLGVALCLLGVALARAFLS